MSTTTRGAIRFVLAWLILTTAVHIGERVTFGAMTCHSTRCPGGPA